MTSISDMATAEAATAYMKGDSFAKVCDYLVDHYLTGDDADAYARAWEKEWERKSMFDAKIGQLGRPLINRKASMV